MTAVLDADVKPPDAPTDEPTAAVMRGAWPARAGAFAVDTLPGVAVVATTALLALASPQWGWLWWAQTAVAVIAVVLVAINRVLLPVAKGWSLGRAIFGLRVVRSDGAPVGIGRLLIRDAAHLLDTAALFLGWLWPLWDRRGRTFADMLVDTEVHSAPPPARDARRLTVTVLVAAALACVAAVGLTYQVVYRQDRALDQARDEIAVQGPRIVEQMLSYGIDTMPEDFARAQSLATDAYRPQLAAQQEAVQQGAATTNEYWAVSSAVLSVAKDRSTMLMAMQGQRGVDPADLRFITATVRVDFVRSRDGGWLVDNLTVLTKPRLNGAGQ